VSDFQTPAQQIGPSKKTGAGTWKIERLTSVLLVPLTLWALFGVTQFAGGGYEAATAWLREPLNAGLLLLTLAISLWHMVLGMNVVIEDYVHGTLGRLLLLLNALAGWALFIAGAGAIAAVFLGHDFGV